MNMKNMVRTAGLCPVIVGALALAMSQLGCTRDQLVAEDRGSGETPNFNLGAGDDGSNDNNGNQQIDGSLQDGRGSGQDGAGDASSGGVRGETGGEVGSEVGDGI